MIRMVLASLLPHPNLTCIRHGHKLRCTSNEGHCCVRCGRSWH